MSANDEVTYFSNILKVWSKGMTVTTPWSKEVHKPRLRAVKETFKLLSIQFFHHGREMSVGPLTECISTSGLPLILTVGIMIILHINHYKQTNTNTNTHTYTE